MDAAPLWWRVNDMISVHQVIYVFMRLCAMHSCSLSHKHKTINLDGIGACQQHASSCGWILVRCKEVCARVCGGEFSHTVKNLLFQVPAHKPMKQARETSTERLASILSTDENGRMFDKKQILQPGGINRAPMRSYIHPIANSKAAAVMVQVCSRKQTNSNSQRFQFRSVNLILSNFPRGKPIRHRSGFNVTCYVTVD